jgi:hypothetical protein
MRWLFPVLLAAFAASSAGATCVTRMEQRGDAGPWVGEFVNYNQYRADTFETTVVVTDANGNDAGPTAINICPAELEPGESAAFELRLSGAARGDLVMPLSAAPPAIGAYSGFNFEAPRSALAVRVISMDQPSSTASIELRNTSPSTAYPNGRACGIARDAAGGIVSVSRPVDLTNLDPGESITQTLSFTTLAGVTTIVPFARVSEASILAAHSDGSRLFDLGSFRITLPRGWHYYPQQGIDSFVGRLASEDGAQMYFDYGWYSGGLEFEDITAGSTPVRYADDPNYVVLHEEIDGFGATIVHPVTGKPGRTAVHVADVEERRAITPNMATSLLISGDNFTAAQQQQALAIFRSIDFIPR